MRGVAGLGVVLLLLLPMGVAKAEPYEIEVNEAGISVRADEASPYDVLLALGEQMGFKLVMDGDEDLPPLTASFRVRSLKLAIDAVIANTASWIMIHDQNDQKPIELRVLATLGSRPSRSGIASNISEVGDEYYEREYELDEELNEQQEELRDLRHLARTGGDEAIHELSVGATAPYNDETVRAVAVTELGQFGGDEAVETIFWALSDPSTAVRRRAIQAAAKSDDPALAQEIGALMLSSPNTGIRREAVRAISSMSSSDEMETLLWIATSDSDRGVQFLALKALANR